MLQNGWIFKLRSNLDKSEPQRVMQMDTLTLSAHPSHPVREVAVVEFSGSGWKGLLHVVHEQIQLGPGQGYPQ